MKISKIWKFGVPIALTCVLFIVTAILLASCGGTKIRYNADAFSKEIFAGNVNLELSDNDGIIFNKASEDEIDQSGSTYFNEEDKNLDWSGKKTTFSFDLELSAMENGDFTIWVLAFNKQNDDQTYSHVEEIRLGIAKTEAGYVASELVGVSWTNADYDNIIANGTSFEIKDNDAEIEFVVNYDNSKLSYTFNVNEIQIEGQKDVEGIVGFRSLWNAATSVNGIVLENLTQSY